MKTFTLYRYDSTDTYTHGILFYDHTYICDTLEKPWKDNTPFISCIPEGSYSMSKYISPSRKEECILIKNVPGRDSIELHEANQVDELEGCIGVGVKSLEIVLHSKEKLGVLLDILGTDIGLISIERI